MIWFTADVHLGHANILKYNDRSYLGKTIEEHDEAIIKLWNERIDKHDTIYIGGDFLFYDTERKRKVLQRLNGNKVLILGNHDKIPDHLKCYFNHITLIKNITFKKTVFDFLDEDFKVVICHYPMLSWEHKTKGVCILHGHVHGRLDNLNSMSEELRVDIGVDGTLANKELFIPLTKLYKHFKKIAKPQTLKDYSDKSPIR